jgi:cysteine desulfurase/selenocysteine lyase
LELHRRNRGYDEFFLDVAKGYIQAMDELKLWDIYGREFPVRKSLIYLNHAAVSPLCLRASEAMQGLISDATLYGSIHYETWMKAYERLRVAAAKLINAGSTEIALVKNTSEGIAMVATGMKWKRGDIVVAFREEFPSNFYPWKRLEPQGVEVRWLSAFDPLDRIDEACRGARLLAISSVQYLSGHRVDLDAIGEICERHGTLFFVDAIQGLGAFPLDVARSKIHALAADGHKWMLGPEGCGILYVRKDFQDEVEPMEFGWTNSANYFDYSSRDMTLRPDAGRYECGTLNTAGCFGLAASLQFLLEVGIDRIAPAVQSRADQIYEGVRRLGFETLTERTPATGAGIVSFRKAGVESLLIVRRLKEAKISVASRQGWVRAAPHFYISPEDVNQVLDVLQTI